MTFKRPPLTPLQKHFLETIARFTYTTLSTDDAQVILDKIYDQELEPFHDGMSLHLADACYMVDGKPYQVLEVLGEEGATVSLIKDNAPWVGPIDKTYR